MAAPTAAVAAAGSASRQNQRRATFKKQRRKKRRQALAQIRDSELQGDGEHQDSEEGDAEEERQMEEERQKLHLEWMERERVAQEEFKLKREREEAAKRKQEEEERRIKEEWEAREKKEQEAREQKQQEKRDRERVTILHYLLPQDMDEAVQKMLDQAESQLDSTGPWKNPEAPVDYGTEKDRANCPFFLKTGACRFGERCSRKHVHPTCSSTLMIRGMFVTFGMEQCRRDDYDTDASLEYSEEEVRQQFLEFYEDVLPEFKSAGKVVQFKVSCNFEPHLRGNVYVQYDTDEQCKEAFLMFNGRWYAGKQLQCEFSPVTRWKTAICGLFDRQKCPKGKHCNFLHVYRNPGNEYWEADRDLHLSPDRGGSLPGRYSERQSERRDRSHRLRSYSPDRSHGRRRERRSRSRERRSRSRERRSRSRERRSRSRERRSRSRESRWSLQSSRRNKPSFRRERSRSRERSRNGDKDRLKPERRNGSPLDQNNKSLSKSFSPKRRTSSSKDSSRKKHSSKEPERTDKPSDGSPVPRHHKHSKKSKKKKGKKKKKRSRSSGGCSSADSDGDSLTRSSGKPVDQSISPGDVEGIQSTEGDVALISSQLMHLQETSSQPCLPEGGDVEECTDSHSQPLRGALDHTVW